jgi:hypothetical protein
MEMFQLPEMSLGPDGEAQLLLFCEGSSRGAQCWHVHISMQVVPLSCAKCGHVDMCR